MRQIGLCFQIIPTSKGKNAYTPSLPSILEAIIINTQTPGNLEGHIVINFKSPTKYISWDQVSQERGMSGQLKLQSRVLPLLFPCLEWCLKTDNCL